MINNKQNSMRITFTSGNRNSSRTITTDCRIQQTPSLGHNEDKLIKPRKQYKSSNKD